MTNDLKPKDDTYAKRLIFVLGNISLGAVLGAIGAKMWGRGR